jgi:hypothetical protein
VAAVGGWLGGSRCAGTGKGTVARAVRLRGVALFAGVFARGLFAGAVDLVAVTVGGVALRRNRPEDCGSSRSPAGSCLLRRGLPQRSLRGRGGPRRGDGGRGSTAPKPPGRLPLKPIACGELPSSPGSSPEVSSYGCGDAIWALARILGISHGASLLAGSSDGSCSNPARPQSRLLIFSKVTVHGAQGGW